MKTIRYILFFILLTALVLPAIQQYTGLIHEKPLSGAIEKPVRPHLTLKSWFDASFQEKYDDYLEQGIGFRPTLIRINNQVAFSLFDTAQANGVIIGKNNYLYEANYIKAYLGLDYIGDARIREQLTKARFVQDKLKENNKHFLLIFAPGKASYFPEYFPEGYRNTKQGSTNYASFINNSKELGVNYIDFNDWFLKMKKTSPYPLYSKTGIHWSLYGVALAVDSLVRYMENVSGKPMIDFGWDGIDLSRTPRDTDNDVAEGMNLLFPISSGELAYPRIRYNEVPGQVKPSVLVVGDSYYWNIMGSGISERLFSNNEFWFYNQEAHNPKWPVPKNVKDIDLLESVNKQDFIILISTEANLNRFPYGFLDELEKAYTHPNNAVKMTAEDKEKLIREIMTQIRNSPESMVQIKKKAIDKNVTVEEMIRLDAGWIFDNKYGTR